MTRRSRIISPIVRSQRLPALGLAACALLVLVLAASAIWHSNSFLPIDTQQVLQGTSSLDHCARAHIWSRCEGPGRPVGPFPPAQYVLALSAKRLGASFGTAEHLMTDTSAICALGVVLLMAYASRRLLPPRLGLVMLLVAISGPLAWYSESGFGEALAMFLTLAAVASFALRWPVAVTVLAVLLAGLTKETAPLFLVPLIGVIAVARRQPVGALLPVAAPALAVALVNGGFDLWRYGTFYNEYYSEPARLTPGIGLKLEFFAGQLVAPNAGLLWFWPAATIVLVGSIVLGFREQRRASLLLLGTTTGLLAVFAAYHSPYGWNALGPRYLLPWVPSLCLAGALVARDQLEQALQAAGRHLFAAGVVAVVLMTLALPQMGMFVAPLKAFDLFADSSPPCYYVAAGVLEAFEHPNFYDCNTHLAWGAHPVLLDGYRPLLHGFGPPLAILMCLSVGFVAAASLRRPPP